MSRFWYFVVALALGSLGPAKGNGHSKSRCLDALILDVTSADSTSKGRPAAVRMMSFNGESEVCRIGTSEFWTRGSSSKLKPKKAYRLEMQDAGREDRDVELLGMAAEADWVLAASYADKTLIRDVLAYDLWREMGYYAPRWRFVELFIVTNGPTLNELDVLNRLNGTNDVTAKFETQYPKEVRKPDRRNRAIGPPLMAAAGRYVRLNYGRGLMPEVLPHRHEPNETPTEPSPRWPEGMPGIDSVWPGISKQGLGWENYHGVYILMEKIKRGKDRLNIKKLKPEHGGEPAITGGYIFKKDRLNHDEKGFRSRLGIEFAFEEPKERDITPAQRAYLTNYVNEFEEALFSERFSDPEHGYRKYIDVDSFIDYHWMSEMARNVDAYWFSIFLHKDRGGKLKMGPIWDYDLAFGNAFFAESYMTNGWRWGRADGEIYGWYQRLFEDPDFLQRYIDRWAEIRATAFATSNLLGKIDRYVNELGSEAIDRNYKRWPTLGKAVQKVAFTGKTYQEELDWLKSWIAGRLAWIDTQDFPGPLIHSQGTKTQSGEPCANISMAWLVGQVFYTLDGSDPRLSGGAVSPKALEYKQPVTASSGAQLCARVRSEHGLWSAPRVLKIP
jgi:hypothetical protein